MEYEQDDVYLKVRKIISDVLNREEQSIEPKSRIVEDLGAQSLDLVTLLIEFEDNFNKKIPDDDVKQLVTVEDVVKYIAQKA